MTTEERLARLTERHEALAQTVEILASDLREKGEKPKPLAKLPSKRPAGDDDEPRVIDVKWLD